MNKLLVAALGIGSAWVANAGVPSGNLPLITDGLAVHLDASDTSTFTLDSDNRVLEWRSKVGTVKFAQGADQNVTNLPYWKESINVPSTAKVPGVVFGVVPGYEYTSSTSQAGAENCVRTWIQATDNVDSKEVFLVMVNHPRTAGYGSATVEGESVTMRSVDGYFFQTGGTPNRSLCMYGNAWSVGVMSADDYIKDTGYAWLNGEKVVDWPNEIYRVSGTKHGFTFKESTLYCLDAVGDTSVSNEGVPTLGRNDYYAPSMDVCEVAIYNRMLTDAERTYVTTALQNKWQNKVACIEWKGTAGDGKWLTAANWSGNAVPTASDMVAVGTANITVDADAECGYLASVDATITIAEGARFEAKLGAVYNSTITGVGTLKLSDTIQTVILPEGLTLGSALTLQAGYGSTLDLNGKSVSLGSLTGGRPVTNSAATTATLTLGAARNGVLDAVLQGDVKLVKEGTATELEVSAAQANTGDTELNGGMVTAVKKLVVDTMPGCVLHVDASCRDTLTVDTNGYVIAWKSTVDPDDVFYTATTNEFMGEIYKANFHPPIYCVTGVNERLPAVRFGYDTTLTNLHGNTTMKLGTTGRKADVFNRTHRTVFIVDTPTITGNDTVVPYGKYYVGSKPQTGYPYPILWYNYYGNTSYLGKSDWGQGTNEIYRNSQLITDVIGGVIPNSFGFSASSVPPRCMIPHVLTVAIPEAAYSTNDTFRPVIGGYVFRSYDDHGSYESYAFAGNICELIVFDRYLPDDERRTIETYLIDKWIEKANFTPPPEWPAERKFDNAFSTASTLVVKQDTTLAPIGKQALGAITVDAQGGTTVPCLTTVGEIVVTNSALTLTGVDHVKSKGKILSSDTAVTGPFKSVEGLTSGRDLVYKAKEVFYRVITGLTLMIK